MAKSHWEIIERINFLEKLYRVWNVMVIVMLSLLVPFARALRWKAQNDSVALECDLLFKLLCALIGQRFIQLLSASTHCLHHNYHHHHLKLNSYLKIYFSERIYNFKNFKMFELNVRNVFRRRLCGEITIWMWLKPASDSLK